MSVVGEALLARARAAGCASIAVIGTSKNAGKSVVVGELCEALRRARVSFGLCSIGRDGEAIDAVDRAPKPRFYLRSGAVIATAASLLPRSPAVEILGQTGESSALGPIVLAAVRAPGYFEISGPPLADALRRVAGLLSAHAPFVLIDGAVDRIAALRDGSEAIVLAVGAAGAPTIGRAVDDIAALAGRLRIPIADPEREAIRIPGALGAEAAAAFARAGERRQIVVRDGTRLTFGGRTFLELSAQLDVRCERRLRPVACTVAPSGGGRFFEPLTFLQAVAERTGLPAYDVYAQNLAEARVA